MTQILVWEGKHSTNYYDASTYEKLDEACIEILRDWLEEEKYLGPWEPYITNKERELAATNIEGLDPSVLALVEKDVLKARRSIKQKEAQYVEQQEDAARIRAWVAAGKSEVLIAGKDTPRERKVPASWRLLADLRGGEYQTVSEETLWTKEGGWRG